MVLHVHRVSLEVFTFFREIFELALELRSLNLSSLRTDSGIRCAPFDNFFKRLHCVARLELLSVERHVIFIITRSQVGGQLLFLRLAEVTFLTTLLLGCFAFGNRRLLDDAFPLLDLSYFC